MLSFRQLCVAISILSSSPCLASAPGMLEWLSNVLAPALSSGSRLRISPQDFPSAIDVYCITHQTRTSAYRPKHLSNEEGQPTQVKAKFDKVAEVYLLPDELYTKYQAACEKQEGLALGLQASPSVTEKYSEVARQFFPVVPHSFWAIASNDPLQAAGSPQDFDSDRLLDVSKALANLDETYDLIFDLEEGDEKQTLKKRRAALNHILAGMGEAASKEFDSYCSKQIKRDLKDTALKLYHDSDKVYEKIGRVVREGALVRRLDADQDEVFTDIPTGHLRRLFSQREALAAIKPALIHMQIVLALESRAQTFDATAANFLNTLLHAKIPDLAQRVLVGNAADFYPVHILKVQGNDLHMKTRVVFQVNYASEDGDSLGMGRIFCERSATMNMLTGKFSKEIIRLTKNSPRFASDEIDDDWPRRSLGREAKD